MAAILLVVDGMTDEEIPEFGNVTPFEFAPCREIHSIKGQGAYGLFENCPPGFPVDTAVCVLTLLGVPPQALPRYGRAFFEARSAGIPVDGNDLVCRINLAEVDEDGLLSSSCGGGLDSAELEQYAALAIKSFHSRENSLYYLGSYKMLAVFHGKAGEEGRIASFPPHESCGRPLAGLAPAGGTAADLVKQWLQDSLALLPRKNGKGYCLFPWGFARREKLPSFQQLHGCHGAAVCATEIVRGIGIEMGLYLPPVPGATAETDTDLNAKAALAIELCKEYPFVLVHVNGADEASHRKNPREKADFLRRVDSQLVKVLLQQTDANLLVCSDHSTLSLTGKHRADLQPFVLRGRGKTGNLGILSGIQAVEILLERR